MYMIYKENINAHWGQGLKIFIDVVHEQNYVKTTPYILLPVVGLVSMAWPGLTRSFAL